MTENQLQNVANLLRKEIASCVSNDPHFGILIDIAEGLADIIATEQNINRAIFLDECGVNL